MMGTEDDRNMLSFMTQ